MNYGFKLSVVVPQAIGISLCNMDTGTDPSYVTRNKKRETKHEIRKKQDTGLEGFGPSGKINVKQTPLNIYYEYKIE